MNKLTVVENIKNLEVIGIIERSLEKAKAGEIKEVMIIYNNSDGGYTFEVSFEERVRILGYLTFATYKVNHTT